MLYLRRQRVLIVDDEPLNLRILTEELAEDHEIEIAQDGESALDMARSTDPDLIILDVMMPGMDGYEVCRKLKESRRTRDIPVIFLTAYDGRESEAKCLDAGGLDFVTKPFSLPLIKSRIRTHLELAYYRSMIDEFAGIDSVTAVPNRVSFDRLLEKEWKRGLRDQLPLAVLLIAFDCPADLEKEVDPDDRDSCLQHLAAIFEGSLQRPADFLARLDENLFGIILPATGLRGARHMAQSISERTAVFSMPIRGSGGFITVKVVIGGAVHIPSREDKPEMLFETAANCLDESRSSGEQVINETC